MGQSRECYPRNIMTEDGGVTRDEWDDIRTALLEMAALLRENVRSLGGITEELERLRLEMAEFRAVVDELRGWVGEGGGERRGCMIASVRPSNQAQ